MKKRFLLAACVLLLASAAASGLLRFAFDFGMLLLTFGVLAGVFTLGIFLFFIKAKKQGGLK